MKLWWLDDDFDRSIRPYEVYLKMQGHDVVGFGTGGELIGRARQTLAVDLPDIVLCDLLVGLGQLVDAPWGADHHSVAAKGLLVAKALSQMNGWNAVPVVIVSASRRLTPQELLDSSGNIVDFWPLTELGPARQLGDRLLALLGSPSGPLDDLKQNSNIGDRQDPLSEFEFVSELIHSLKSGASALAGYLQSIDRYRRDDERFEAALARARHLAQDMLETIYTASVLGRTADSSGTSIEEVDYLIQQVANTSASRGLRTKHILARHNRPNASIPLPAAQVDWLVRNLIHLCALNDGSISRQRLQIERQITASGTLTIATSTGQAIGQIISDSRKEPRSRQTNSPTLRLMEQLLTRIDGSMAVKLGVDNSAMKISIPLMTE